jgi:hypothetical protein
MKRKKRAVPETADLFGVEKEQIPNTYERRPADGMSGTRKKRELKVDTVEEQKNNTNTTTKKD